jgi:hypothetical protein
MNFLVNEILRRLGRTPIEGGDPARQHVDEAVQLQVRKCPVDVSVSFRGVAVEVVRPENNFERTAAAVKTPKALHPRDSG